MELVLIFEKHYESIFQQARARYNQNSEKALEMKTMIARGNEFEKHSEHGGSAITLNQIGNFPMIRALWRENHCVANFSRSLSNVSAPLSSSPDNINNIPFSSPSSQLDNTSILHTSQDSRNNVRNGNDEQLISSLSRELLQSPCQDVPTKLFFPMHTSPSNQMSHPRLSLYNSCPSTNQDLHSTHEYFFDNSIVTRQYEKLSSESPQA